MSSHPSIELRMAAFRRGRVSQSNSDSVLSAAIEIVLQRYLKRVASTVSSSRSATEGVKAVLLKPVSDLCNLRCTYCYEGDGKNRVVQKRMTEVLLKRVIDTALQQADGPIEFIWHGGEPLLAGLRLFQLGIELQRQSKFAKDAIYNSVQTNGLLINPAWIKFFKEHAFSVGVSFDGPADVHDKYRIDGHGEGTQTKVCAAISQLRDANVPFGIITVIHPELVSRADEYIAGIISMGIKYIDIHPSHGDANSRHRPLDSTEFSTFCIALFDEWLRSGLTDLRINLFDDFLRGYFFGAPETCYFAGTCSSIAAVEADGSVVPCTRPFDRAAYTFGTIGLSSLRGTLKSSNSLRFTKLDHESQAKASNCRWYYLCHNGCPQHRKDADGSYDIGGANVYCGCTSGAEGGHLAVWDHIAKRLNETYLI